MVDIGKNTQIPDLANSLKILTEYNVPHSKKTRGLGTVLSYKQIEHPDKLTPDNIRLANILGWCTEMVSIFFLYAHGRYLEKTLHLSAIASRVSSTVR